MSIAHHIDYILGCLLLKEAGEGLQVLVCGSPAGCAVLPVLAPTQGLRYAQAALHPAEQVLLFNWDRI